MAWDSLPLEIYQHIFRNLSFFERKPLSLVCRRWNQAVFSRLLSPRLCIFLSEAMWLMDDRICLVDAEVIEASERDYPVVYVKWRSDSSAEKVASINRMLTELDKKCFLEELIVTAPLEALYDFFQAHQQLLTKIKRLQVYTAKEDTEPIADRCTLKMDQLEVLHWDELTSGHARNDDPIFVINAPKLHSAVVEYNYYNSWPNSCMELSQYASLKKFHVHLYPEMRTGFFEKRSDALEEITLENNEKLSWDWDRIFSNMPNLKSINMTSVDNDILCAIIRHCPQLRTFICRNVDLTGQILSVAGIFPQLQHFELKFAQIHSTRPLYLPNLKYFQLLHIENYNEQPFILDTPMLHTLRLCALKESDVIVAPKTSLKYLWLEIGNTGIPEHYFQPFPCLRKLDIFDYSWRSDLVRLMPYVAKITEFNLSVDLGQGDPVLIAISKYCNNLSAMNLCGIGNLGLELSFPVFAQIFSKLNLKSLSVTRLTVTGNSFRLHILPGLKNLEFIEVKIMDVAFGADVFSSDESDRLVYDEHNDGYSYWSTDHYYTEENIIARVWETL
ncbi:uncharacterized protein LOC134220459 [Armigeres subalbatus]|uniref:uncharacterized protein LOC134220459 n=1 Tax=Armigeres subalbatus TaxID=124917 RepID=UPI002ED3BA22